MLSRDNENWLRYDDAFLRPGPEWCDGWVYGDCYPALGFVESPGMYPGSDNELSFYLGARHASLDHELLRRYTLRLDGFGSRYAGYKPETLVTKPFIFSGNTMTLNFATSAIGYVLVTLRDLDGNSICSCRLFCDRTDRIVDFDGDLAAFAGKPAQLEFSFADADIYSFRFYTEESMEDLADRLRSLQARY